MATAILGMQWGDEGKGKIAHLLAKDADMVVRYNGGANAGHTMIDRGTKFGTHLIPAGAFYPGTTSVLASGMVIDMWVLRSEYDEISDHLGEAPDIAISNTAHLILPYHKTLEDLEGSGARIGTTRRGIGTAYRDRAARAGIRAVDLLHPEGLRARLAEHLGLLRRMWPSSADVEGLDATALADDLLSVSAPFLDSIRETRTIVRQAVEEGKKVLFEGAQGAMLDVDYGTYPYVTSSSTTFAGLRGYVGIPSLEVDKRIGVCKAYTTRVGEGPFPTELVETRDGQMLREKGNEFGVTTGRPRRCGWLDLVALRHAVSLNDPSELVITKLDVLSGIDEVKACTAYEREETEIKEFGYASAAELGACKPVFSSFPGWSEDIREIRKYEALPRAARIYLEMISADVGVPINLVSVGPAPEETMATGFDS